MRRLTSPAAISIGADGSQLSLCLLALALQENFSRSHIPCSRLHPGSDGTVQKPHCGTILKAVPAPDLPMRWVEACVYHHSPNPLSAQSCFLPPYLSSPPTHTNTLTH